MDAAGRTGRKQKPDWATIRTEYEGRLFEPKVICERHGVTAAQLRYRRQCEGWLSQRERKPKEAVLVARMLKILEQQIRDLGMAKDIPVERRTTSRAGYPSSVSRFARSTFSHKGRRVS